MSTLLDVQQLCKSYRKQSGLFRYRTVQALDNISFSLQQGKTLAVVGETGSGKSTLAKLLVGIEKPDQGRILLDNTEVQLGHYRQYNHQVRFIFQDAAKSLNPQ